MMRRWAIVPCSSAVGHVCLLRSSLSLTDAQQNGVCRRNSMRRTSSCINGPMPRSSHTANLQVGSCVQSSLVSMPSVDWPLSSFGISKSRSPHWRTILLGNGLSLTQWLVGVVIHFVFSGHTLRASNVDISLKTHPNSITHMSVIRISTLRLQPRLSRGCTFGNSKREE